MEGGDVPVRVAGRVVPVAVEPTGVRAIVRVAADDQEPAVYECQGFRPDAFLRRHIGEGTIYPDTRKTAKK